MICDFSPPLLSSPLLSSPLSFFAFNLSSSLLANSISSPLLQSPNFSFPIFSCNVSGLLLFCLVLSCYVLYCCLVFSCCRFRHARVGALILEVQHVYMILDSCRHGALLSKSAATHACLKQQQDKIRPQQQDTLMRGDFVQDNKAY